MLSVNGGGGSEKQQQIWVHKNRMNDVLGNLPSKRRKATKENICDDTNRPNIDF